MLLTFGRFNVAIENTLFDFEAGLSLELTFAFRGTNDLIEKFGIIFDDLTSLELLGL